MRPDKHTGQRNATTEWLRYQRRFDKAKADDDEVAMDVIAEMAAEARRERRNE